MRPLRCGSATGFAIPSSHRSGVVGSRHDVPSQISASDFKATCLEVMDEVARTGVELIVTKHGRPWVRLSAVGKTCDSPWGFLAGSVVRHARYRVVR